MIKGNKYFAAFLFLSVFLRLPVYGQHISDAMQFVSPVNDKDSNTLFFSYSNLAYFKNYEYYNKIQTGYTLFGVWQHPRLSYVAGKSFKIEAGVLLQKDFGDKNFDRALPTFSMQYQKKDYRLIFGALEGNQSHQLIEPLFQYDQVIERPVEEGFQFKFTKKRIWSDLWVDWQKRQKINANNSEEFISGFSFRYQVTNPDKPFKIKIPLQVITFHRGGQLDTTNTSESTILNYAAGIWAEWNSTDKNGLLQQVRTDAYYTKFARSESKGMAPFNNGNGFLANLYIQSKWNISLLATYWNGENYVAPQGGKLYQSVSSISNTPGYTESKRELLFLNFVYEKELVPGLFVDARFTPYLDLRNKLTEYAYQLFISYRHDFRLVTIKKKSL